jgi:hypothetical protein
MSRRSLALFGSLCAALVSSVPVTAWADNPLPPLPPGRQLDFGYYFSDGQYGDYNAETRCYTNLYVPAVEDQELPGALAAAAAAGQVGFLHLQLEWDDDTRAKIEARTAALLAAAAGQWDTVEYVELWHEPNVYRSDWEQYMPPEQVNVRAQIVRDVLADRGLAPKRLGVSLARGDVFLFGAPPNVWTNSTLDYINFQAYLYPSDDVGSTCDIVGTLASRLRYMADRVAPKSLVLAMQSYTFHGGWANIPALLAMQGEYYRFAASEPRVQALVSFAYNHSGDGVVAYPELRGLHKQIGERVRHGLPPGCAEPASPLPTCGGGGGTAPSNLRVVVENLFAQLTWQNGTGNPLRLRLFQRDQDDPNWQHIAFLEPNVTSTEVHLGTPGPGGNTKCFRLEAQFGDGNPPSSPEVCATYFASAPDLAPNANSPVGCVSEAHPLLRWDAVPRTTKHWIYLVHTPDDTGLVNDDQAGAGTVYDPAVGFVAGHRYRWKVAAGNNFDFGPWSNPEGLYFTPGCRARADWNADGSTDLLLRDPVTGNLSLVYLNGSVQTGAAALNPPKPSTGNWTAVGTNDFNADAKPDVVWQNTDSGNLAFWLFDGVNRTAGATLVGAGSAWKVAGTGDFNFDGRPDLLFRETGTQNLKVFFLNGTLKTGEAAVTSAYTGYASWEIAAVGDLDNDMSPDIVWRQPGTGSLVMWNMRGTTHTGPLGLFPSALPDFGWRMVSIFDVDGNGANDIVWQHETSGRLVTWFMEGTVRRSGGYLTPDTPADPALRAIGPR